MFNDSDVLFHQLEEHDWVYRVIEGFVLIHGCSFEGKEGITDLYGKGSWFGPGLDNGIAVQNATAKQGTLVERFNAAELSQYLLEHPTEPRHIIQQISRREQQLQQRLLMQQTLPLAARLAQLLSHYFSNHGQPCEHGHQVDIRLTQQELASMAGGSRQSVSQLLASWKRDGVIEYTRDHICLEDKSSLQHYFCFQP